MIFSTNSKGLRRNNDRLDLEISLVKKLMMRLGRGSFQLQRVLESFGQLVFRVVKKSVS